MNYINDKYDEIMDAVDYVEVYKHIDLGWVAEGVDINGDYVEATMMEADTQSYAIVKAQNAFGWLPIHVYTANSEWKKLIISKTLSKTYR